MFLVYNEMNEAFRSIPEVKKYIQKLRSVQKCQVSVCNISRADVSFLYIKPKNEKNTCSMTDLINIIILTISQHNDQ